MNNQIERLIAEIADLKNQVAAQNKVYEAKAASQQAIADEILELSRKWLGEDSDCESESGSESGSEPDSEAEQQDPQPDENTLRVMGTVLEFINEQKDGVTRQAIYKHMDMYSVDRALVAEVLSDLVADKEIRQVNKHTFKRIVRRPKN